VHRRRLARGVSCAICVSTALASYANEELGIADFLVMPNGGPLLSSEEIMLRRGSRQDDRFMVLYTGSAIYPWQGLDYLSQVIALAREDAPDLIFVLAVNKLTPDLPKSGNVLVLDHLDRDQILDAVCRADACVSLHPVYPWSRYSFHNSPLKMFEYMACKRPVVASNQGQMREIIHDGVDGLLCENNAKEILGKLLFLRDHPERAASIGEHGWNRIQSEFNWPRNVAMTLEVFERVLGIS
jgi:glycosyltransferase involved in cell wall biosynthesis